MADEPMITLFQFAPNLGLPNPSPFCLKLETWLRMADLEYAVEVTPDPRKAPLGKLPMIEHEGQRIADSGCAISYLENACDVKLNAQLNSAERGISHALMRMLEEHSYWALIYFRWLDEAGWRETREAFFGHLGGLSKAVISRVVRRHTRAQADGQGLSRHSHDEILRRFNDDMNTLAACLGDKPYFGGYQPANIDATVYGLLGNVLQASIRTPLTDLAEQHAVLVQYAERMRDRYFPEYR